MNLLAALALLPLSLQCSAPFTTSDPNPPWRPLSSGGDGRPPFSYHVAASASPKKAKLRPAEHGTTFWTQSFVERSAPSIFGSREAWSGQDAFFMGQIGKSRRHVVFAVADGVGGWEESGVNPAAFSHGLCRHMAEATVHPKTAEDLRPLQVLTAAYELVLEDKKIFAGGSTAVVAKADETGYMEVANLGDSGFVVLSPGRITFKSKPQTSAFNTPFQLSKLTPQMKAQHAIFGGGAPIQDHPGKSDISHHELQHGDVVLFGTDGLWDNLSAMEVLKVVQPYMEKAGFWKSGPGTELKVDADRLRESLLGGETEPGKDVAGQMAYAVMKEAKIASHDMKRDGPFAREVHRYYPNEDFHGGKVDDIAIIAAIAVQDGDGTVKAKL